MVLCAFLLSLRCKNLRIVWFNLTGPADPSIVETTHFPTTGSCYESSSTTTREVSLLAMVLGGITTIPWYAAHLSSHIAQATS